MAKMTQLEAMRAARDQREKAVLDPVVQPLQRRLSEEHRRVDFLQGELDALSSAVANEVSGHALDNIKHMILQRIESEIYKAMAQASGRGADEVITVPLSASMVRFTRPDELTSQLLDKAASTYRTGCRAYGIISAEQSVTYLGVTIPKVEARIALTGISPPRRRRA